MMENQAKTLQEMTLEERWWHVQRQLDYIQLAVSSLAERVNKLEGIEPLNLKPVDPFRMNERSRT